MILSFDKRCKNRFKATTTKYKKSVLVVTSPGAIICHNSWLTNGKDYCVKVIAAAETLYRVTSVHHHALMCAAYHLGNRHVQLEVGVDYLQLYPDPVLRNMLEKLGDIQVTEVCAPFEPETGAYGGGHKHGHDETFAEDYALAQELFQHHHV